jgi:hypothetical protein
MTANPTTARPAPIDRSPATDAELRWAWRRSRFPAMGFAYEQVLAAPVLRSVLELGVTQQRRKRARLSTTNTGAGIERSQPGFSASAQQS